jgi:hypothetical protein
MCVISKEKTGGGGGGGGGGGEGEEEEEEEEEEELFRLGLRKVMKIMGYQTPTKIRSANLSNKSWMW